MRGTTTRAHVHAPARKKEGTNGRHTAAGRPAAQSHRRAARDALRAVHQHTAAATRQRRLHKLDRPRQMLQQVGSLHILQVDAEVAPGGGAGGQLRRRAVGDANDVRDAARCKVLGRESLDASQP